MNIEVYALRLKDKNELRQSSSGGAFTALSQVFLEKKGAIVSAIYNYETHQNEFVIYTEEVARNKARGSKYMQAYPLNSFKEAKKWIEENDKELLFVGTGCQADGFNKYARLNGFRNKTLIVDIICHGVPSPKIWRDYTRKRSHDYLTFKDKRNGWERPTAVIAKENKETSIEDYVDLFRSSYILRPSCYECPYATIEREIDLTIGDYWGIDKVMPDFYSTEGNSLVLVHSEKGKKLFEKIKEQVEWCESNSIDCLQPNLIKPTERSPQREEFWDNYRKGGIKRVLKKYTNTSHWRRTTRKVKQLIKKQFRKEI